MKVKIIQDEWYPFYIETGADYMWADGEIEMTDIEYRAWTSALEQTKYWNNLIKERYNNS